MKRTFWAIKVSEQVEELIRQIYEALPTLKQGIKLVPPENVHITLKFLGDTEESLIDTISGSVREALTTLRPFDITVGGTGVFPSPKRPQVLFLDIKDGLEKLGGISKIIEQRMENLGFSREKRAFVPHLTLGRVKDFRRAWNGVESLLRYTYTPVTFQAREVVYYESQLTPQGAIYTPLTIITLK